MLYLHNILNGIWMMDEAFAANYLPLVAAFIKGEQMTAKPTEVELNKRNSIQFATFPNDVLSVSSNSTGITPENAPQSSIAIINIANAITKQDQECGPAGMKTKSDLLKRCYANDNINSVVLVIDSGGGQGMAMRLMAETISQKNKPVGAFIDDNCCSAAYGIASGCDFIVANSNQAQIGSIGTYITIADYTEKFKQMGVNLIEIYASASTDKNKEFFDAIQGNPEPIRAIANQFNEHFLSLIESNRTDKLKADRTVWGTGKVYFAEKALELGLIDGIDTLENFINYFNT
jgi:ClpP class serine protease